MQSNCPPSHSEKRYDFSALYISVRQRRSDEFWNPGSRAFVATTETHTYAGRRRFLNGPLTTFPRNGWGDFLLSVLRLKSRCRNRERRNSR
jgi:hypothetical protein